MKSTSAHGFSVNQHNWQLNKTTFFSAAGAYAINFIQSAQELQIISNHI